MFFLKRIFLRFYISLICLASSLALPAQTRLVSNAGSDVGNCLGAPCASINYAVSQSTAGDTIQLAQGLYEENVLINVPNIHLEGFQVGISGRNLARDGSQESTVRPPITALGSAIIQIQSDGVSLDGLSLDGRTSVASRGATFQNQSNVVIQNCRIVNLISYSLLGITAAGVYGDGIGSNNLIQENFFENIRQDDIDYALNALDLINGLLSIPDIETYLPGRGIWLQNNCYADVLNNQLDSLTIGVEVNNFNTPGLASRVENNSIDSFLQGISLRNIFSNSSQWRVANNQLTFTQSGLLSQISINFPPFFSATYDFRVPNSAINLDVISRNCIIFNNDIEGSYYGYFAYGTSQISNTLIEGGLIQRVAQGIACLNENDDGNAAETVVRLQNVTMSDFNGEPESSIPATVTILGFDIDLDSLITTAFDFHAGIYGFAANNGQNISISVDNCEIQGTDARNSQNAGIYCNAQIPANGNVNLLVSNSRIFKHLNRGIHLNNINNARLVGCTLDSNGSDGFNNDGVATILRSNSQATFEECVFNNQVGTVYANMRLQGSSTATLLNCSLLSSLHQIDNDGGGDVNAFGCWWGSNDPATVASGFVNTNAGNVDYNPWLDSATDIDLVKGGFQGDWSFFHLSNAGNDLSLDGRIQEAIDSLVAGGVLLTHSATYNESPIVWKNMFLSNDGPVQIDSLELDTPSGFLVLLNDVSISNHLNLRNGYIQNNTAIVSVLNTAPNAVSSSNATSYVQGSLRWNVLPSQEYTFPVGENGSRENMQVRLNNQTGIVSLTARYWPNDPSTSPILSSIVPFEENMIFYGVLITQGYWELNPNPGGNASNYDLSLFPSFLSGAEAAIVKRSLPATVWQADGNPLNVVGGYGRSQINGFSNFTLALESMPLPLQVANFQVSLQNQGAQLTWRVFNNVDINQIRIERAKADLLFSPIATKDIEVSYLPMSYAYTDPEVLGAPSPIWYYRLAYTEQNGELVYSQVIALAREHLDELRVYPNPSRDFIQVTSSTSQSPIRWEIWNSQGKLLTNLEAPDAQAPISIQHLPIGTYFLRWVYPEEVIVRKFLKY